MCTKMIAAALRAITGTPHPKNFTSAVIVAAGLSERFGGSVTKQMSILMKLTLLQLVEQFTVES